jgi:hypothetical protein
MEVDWVASWGIDSDIALNWLGGGASNSSNWGRSSEGTPGSL